MKPISTCEKSSFKALITGLTNDNFVPNRKTIQNILLNKYNLYISDLKEKIDAQKYVCVTTDIWSSLNKSYLGMTLHYIEESTYKRFSYAIACRRIKGTHNYLNIAKCISVIIKQYSLDVTKISHTVTDNATNFGKAFRMYAQQFTSEFTVENDLNLNEQTISKLIENIDQNVENLTEPESEIFQNCIENEFESDDIEIINMSNILSNQGSNLDENEDFDIILSNHMTCSAHTLNLVATTDTTKIIDPAYKKISRSTFGKLSSFWNLLSRSTVASDLVFKICLCKFPIPVVTRWNSFFDSIKKIIRYRAKVADSFEKLNLNKIKTTEWHFLDEYIKVMEPLTIALDKLQGEKTCYLGYVAPTIITLKHILMEQSHLVYCGPLSKAIIRGLEKRYSFVFDLKDPKSKPYILSAISFPKFKLSWVPTEYIEVCQQLFLSECNDIDSAKKIESGNISISENDSGDEFYSLMTQSQSSSSLSEASNNNMGSVQGLSFLNSKKKDGGKELNILDNYPIVKQLFLKYNTTLPSSAPVERLFSSGSQIMIPRRNRLGDKTFEMLVCLKSNKINS